MGFNSGFKGLNLIFIEEFGFYQMHTKFHRSLHLSKHSGVYLDVNQSGLNTEAPRSSETSISTYKPARCPNRDDCHPGNL